MIRIPCPICGLRDETEFTYGGDASRVRPDLTETDMDVWHDYVFSRPNPRGLHIEFWHHVHGCRQVLVVERDTLSHDVSGCRLAAGDGP